MWENMGKIDSRNTSTHTRAQAHTTGTPSFPICFAPFPPAGDHNEQCQRDPVQGFAASRRRGAVADPWHMYIRRAPECRRRKEKVGGSNLPSPGPAISLKCAPPREGAGWVNPLDNSSPRRQGFGHRYFFSSALYPKKIV